MSRKHKLKKEKILSRRFVCFMFLLCSAVTAGAQSLPFVQHDGARVLVGVAGSSGLGNESLGIATSVEVPISRRFEIDASNVYSPIFSHPSAGGRGYTDQAKVGGIVWATKAFGMTGSTEYSSYSTMSVHKWAGYAMIGPIFRLKLLGVPTRLDLQYIREFHNGLFGGIESNKIQGARVGVSGRVGCLGPTCWRLSEDFVFARGLNQGNPVCDGTLGDGSQVGFSPCPRSAFFGASVEVGVKLEFPRYRGREDEVF